MLWIIAIWVVAFTSAVVTLALVYACMYIGADHPIARAARVDLLLTSTYRQSRYPHYTTRLLTRGG